MKVVFISDASVFKFGILIELAIQNVVCLKEASILTAMIKEVSLIVQEVLSDSVPQSMVHHRHRSVSTARVPFMHTRLKIDLAHCLQI